VGPWWERLVKVASKGARFFRSFDSVSAASDKAINTLTRTARSSARFERWVYALQALKGTLRSKQSPAGRVQSAVRSSRTSSTMPQWWRRCASGQEGAYILNHRTRNRKDGKTTNQDEFEGNWDKDPGEISDRALDAVQEAMASTRRSRSLSKQTRVRRHQDEQYREIRRGQTGGRGRTIVMTAKLDKDAPGGRRARPGPSPQNSRWTRSTACLRGQTGDQVDARDITKKQDTVRANQANGCRREYR